jgi:O-antigen ligase/Flp pilus assembly protein TadD
MAGKADRARRSISISPRAEDPFLRISVGIVALALAVIPLVYWTSLTYGFSIPKVTVFRVAVAALCLLGFVWLAGGQKTFRIEPPHVLALAFLGWLFATSLLSSQPLASLLGLPQRFEGLIGITGYVVFFWLATAFQDRHLRLVVWAASASAAAAGAIALLQSQGLVHFPGLESTAGRVSSTLGNAVYLGSLEAVTLCLTLGLVVESRQAWQRVAAVALLACQAVGLVESGSMGAVVGALAGASTLLALLALASRGRRLRPWLPTSVAYLIVLGLLISVAVGAVFLLSSGDGQVSDIVAGRDASSQSRLQEWGGALRLIGERPIVGWGLDTFRAEYPRVRSLLAVQLDPAVAATPHNQWLYLSYAGGIPALLLYLALLVVLAWRTLAFLRDPTGDYARKLLVCLLAAGVVAYEAQSLFSFSLVTVTPLAAVLQGGLVALTRRAPSKPLAPLVRRRSADLAPGTVVSMVLGIGLLLLSLPFLAEGVRQVMADRAEYAATRSTDLSAALRQFRRAASLSPRDPQYALSLGNAYYEASPDDPTLVAEALAAYWQGHGRPAESDLEYSVARVQAATGQLDSAEAGVRATLARDPYHALSLQLLASILLARPAASQHAPEAVSRLKLALEIQPTNARSWVLLGQASELTGDTDAARYAYLQALRFDPANETAKSAIERLGAS